MNEATAEGSTETVRVPESVCLVASRFFFAYDEKYGEFRKRIHWDNPRYAELEGLVDDPAPTREGEHHHGRILEACDVYDVNFHPKGHSIVTVCGGYNGGGSDRKWCEYLGEIAGAIRRLTDRFGFSWLVRLHDHSDVWYAEIGFRDRRGVPADGSDHSPCAGDDFLAYDRHRDAARKARLPFGLVDWGCRSYDWAWERLGGAYPFPRDAFHGSLIRPHSLANHYAAYDADAGRFRDAWGVYAAHNGTRAFYAVAVKNGGFGDLMSLDKADFRALSALPAAEMPLLEDWRPAPRAEDPAAR